MVLVDQHHWYITQRNMGKKDIKGNINSTTGDDLVQTPDVGSVTFSDIIISKHSTKCS